MKHITVTELKQRATQIVSEIEATKEDVIVTKKGKAVVLMRFFSEEDYVLTPKKTEKGKGVKDHG